MALSFPYDRVPASERDFPADLAQTIEADVKRYVARELHDEVVQTLTTVLLDMERFKIEQFGRVSVQQQVALLQDSLRSALDEMRALLYDLRNQPLTTNDFVESVRVDLVERFAARTGVSVDLQVSPAWPAALSVRAAQNLHRAIKEALTNIGNHAGAKSVRIELDVSEERHAVLTIDDDGIGADDTRLRGGLGLVGLEERAVLLGGALSIDSQQGQGTTLRLTVPLTSLE